MKSRVVAAVTVMAVGAGVSAPGAWADPVVPQPDSSCPANLEGALTQAADGTTFLECGTAANGYRWQPLAGLLSSDRWVSYGPELTLHGQGRRNPEILSGDWIGRPQDPVRTCGVEQAAG